MTSQTKKKLYEKDRKYAITFYYVIFYIKNAKINELLVFYKKILHF